MNSLFSEKCTVIMASIVKCLKNNPELIGFVPLCSTENQLSNAFDYWLHQHIANIKQKVNSITVFLAQIITLKADPQDWTSFLHSWKLQRIFAENDFDLTWAWMVQELSVELKKNDIQEAGDDENIDILI